MTKTQHQNRNICNETCFLRHPHEHCLTPYTEFSCITQGHSSAVTLRRMVPHHCVRKTAKLLYADPSYIIDV